MKSLWFKLALALAAPISVLAARPSASPPGYARALLGAPPPPFAVQKADAVARLKTVIEAEAKGAATLEEQIGKLISESRDVRLQGVRSVDGKTERIMDSVDEALRKRDERVAKRQAYERILFEVDSKWNAPPLKDFLERELLELAITEATDQTPRAKFWKFYTNASVALRELAEPRENAIDFVVSYANFASISHPRPASSFIRERNYSNGAQTMAARPMAPDKAGDAAEKRLRELGLLRPPAETRSARGLRSSEMSVRYAPTAAEKERAHEGSSSGSTSPIPASRNLDGEPGAGPTAKHAAASAATIPTGSTEKSSPRVAAPASQGGGTPADPSMIH